MQVTWMGSDLLLVSLFPLKFSESWVIFFFFFKLWGFFNVSVQTLHYIGIDSLSLFVSNKMNEILEVQFQPAAVVYLWDYQWPLASINTSLWIKSSELSSSFSLTHVSQICFFFCFAFFFYCFHCFISTASGTARH